MSSSKVTQTWRVYAWIHLKTELNVEYTITERILSIEQDGFKLRPSAESWQFRGIRLIEADIRDTAGKE